jgi:hypothetical protein
MKNKYRLLFTIIGFFVIVFAIEGQLEMIAKSGHAELLRRFFNPMKVMSFVV